MKLRIYALPPSDNPGYGHETNDFTEGFLAAVKNFPQAPDRNKPTAWEYVQIILESSYRSYRSGNGGAQAWRHKKTGYTIPDYCRQTGGCPEMWYKSKRPQLIISHDSPVIDYLAPW